VGSPLIKRYYGSAKPPSGAQVDTTHPLAQGLVDCFLFNEGGGTANNIVRRTAPAAVDAWGTGAVRTTGISSEVGITINGGYSTSGTPAAISIVLGFTPRGAPVGTAHGLWHGNNNTSGAVYLNIHATNATLGFIKSEIAAIATPALSNYTVGKFYPVAFTYDSSGNYALYEGTKQLATGNTAFTFVADTPHFGCEKSNTAVDCSNGDFYYGYVYNRALSSSEVQWLSVAPYAFVVAPVSRAWWFPPPPAKPLLFGIALGEGQAPMPLQRRTLRMVG